MKYVIFSKEQITIVSLNELNNFDWYWVCTTINRFENYVYQKILRNIKTNIDRLLVELLNSPWFKLKLLSNVCELYRLENKYSSKFTWLWNAHSKRHLLCSLDLPIKPFPVTYSMGEKSGFSYLYKAFIPCFCFLKPTSPVNFARVYISTANINNVASGILFWFKSQLVSYSSLPGLCFSSHDMDKSRPIGC